VTSTSQRTEHGISIVEYSSRYGPELVKMWRASFEQAVGIKDPHPLDDQLRALEEKKVLAVG